MAKNDRFENVYSQGGLSTMEIWVDKETGVNYLFHTSGYAGGMKRRKLDRHGLCGPAGLQLPVQR